MQVDELGRIFLTKTQKSFILYLLGEGKSFVGAPKPITTRNICVFWRVSGELL
jgi:hypothetical protein